MIWSSKENRCTHRNICFGLLKGSVIEVKANNDIDQLATENIMLWTHVFITSFLIDMLVFFLFSLSLSLFVCSPPFRLRLLDFFLLFPPFRPSALPGLLLLLRSAQLSSSYTLHSFAQLSPALPTYYTQALHYTDGEETRRTSEGPTIFICFFCQKSKDIPTIYLPNICNGKTKDLMIWCRRRMLEASPL